MWCCHSGGRGLLDLLRLSGLEGLVDHSLHLAGGLFGQPALFGAQLALLCTQSALLCPKLALLASQLPLLCADLALHGTEPSFDSSDFALDIGELLLSDGLVLFEFLELLCCFLKLGYLLRHVGRRDMSLLLQFAQ